MTLSWGRVVVGPASDSDGLAASDGGGNAVGDAFCAYAAEPSISRMVAASRMSKRFLPLRCCRTSHWAAPCAVCLWRNFPIFARMFPEIAAHIEMGGLHRETERSMSLRMRLGALVGLVLLFSVACGSGLVAWRAMHS